jgi:hypothetical protein
VFPLVIPEKLRNSSTLATVSPDDLTFDVGDDTMSMRLFLQNLTIRNPRYQSGSTVDANYYPGGTSGLAIMKEKK